MITIEDSAHVVSFSSSAIALSGLVIISICPIRPRSLTATGSHPGNGLATRTLIPAISYLPNGFESNYAMTTAPLVSVLMPVCNGAPYLAEALQCILDQTFANFELIVIDDGSTDDSLEIIQQFKDSRIQAHRQDNLGLAATLNRAIELARGEYLARQDQDDVSLPQRFEKQVGFLAAHPTHAMVGTWSRIWVENQETGRSHRHPAESYILKWELLFNNPFVHSSIMIRKSVMKKMGGYCTDRSRQPPEDYELWSRIAREFELGNIPEFLHIYREVPKSMSRDGVNPFLDNLIRISAENLAWAVGKAEPDQICFDLAALVHGARQRVSPHFRMEDAARVLWKAADRLGAASNAERSQLRERAEVRLHALRQRHLQHKQNHGMAFLRRLPGRLVGRFRKIVT